MLKLPMSGRRQRRRNRVALNSASADWVCPLRPLRVQLELSLAGVVIHHAAESSHGGAVGDLVRRRGGLKPVTLTRSDSGLPFHTGTVAAAAEGLRVSRMPATLCTRPRHARYGDKEFAAWHGLRGSSVSVPSLAPTTAAFGTATRMPSHFGSARPNRPPPADCPRRWLPLPADCPTDWSAAPGSSPGPVSSTKGRLPTGEVLETKLETEPSICTRLPTAAQAGRRRASGEDQQAFAGIGIGIAVRGCDSR